MHLVRRFSRTASVHVLPYVRYVSYNEALKIFSMPEGVSVDPSLLKQRYQELVLNHHPDLRPGPQSTEMMQKINAARDILLGKGAAEEEIEPEEEPISMKEAVLRGMTSFIQEKIGALSDREREALLRYATMHHKRDIMKILLDAGVDKTCTISGLSILEWAVHYGNIDTVKFLIWGKETGAVGPFPSSLLPAFQNALYAAIASKSLLMLEFVLALNVVDINQGSFGDSSPIHNAMRNWSGLEFPMIQLLLRYGADANIQSRSGAQTPLISVANKYASGLSDTQRAQIAKILIQAGADVNHGHQFGKELSTPLSMACENAYIKLGKVLIESGARVEGIDSEFVQLCKTVSMDQQTPQEQAEEKKWSRAQGGCPLM
jgi:ankyrin repeat protein